MSEEFDYIVIGAGSSGATLAARLAERENVSILLLEAGEARQNDFWITTPIGIGKILQDEKYIWPSHTQPQENLNGQKIYWPHGKLVGGSSSVNGMLHVRGDPGEYDRWHDQGLKGWGYQDLLPFFKRLEHFDRDPGDFRGHDGPVRVTSFANSPDPLSEAFIQACIETGIPPNPDYNGRTYEGVSYLQMSAHRGKRCGTAAAYLKKPRRNLKIETSAHVQKIIIENLVARGVEYVHHGQIKSAFSRAEILVSCGPIKSPQLLELSGIGNADRLREHDIPVLHHSPEVGENLIDHLQSRINFECTQAITLNDVLNNRFRTLAMGAGYLFNRRGFMATSGATAHALVRTAENEIQPNVKIQLHHLSARDRYAVKSGNGLDPFSGFSIGFFQLRPSSRGSIHIQSNNINTDPTIDPAYLSTNSDIATALSAFKKTRAISQNDAMLSYIAQETMPGPDIASDEEILGYIKESGQTSWHPVGTCRMGVDDNSVVTPDLQVRGVHKLRVIDSSVMPTMASSNTNIPAIMIGEKGADLVLQGRSTS